MILLIVIVMVLLLMIGMALIVKEVSERCERERYWEMVREKFPEVAEHPEDYDMDTKVMFDDCTIVYVINKTPYYEKLKADLAALKAAVSKLVKEKADSAQVNEAVKAYQETRLKLEKFKNNTELGAVRMFTVDWR